METALERLDRFARLWEAVAHDRDEGAPLSEGEALALAGALGAPDGWTAALDAAEATRGGGEALGATLELDGVPDRAATHEAVVVHVRDVRADGVDVVLDAPVAPVPALAHGDLCVLDAVLGRELRIPVEVVGADPSSATLRVTGAPTRRSIGPDLAPR